MRSTFSTTSEELRPYFSEGAKIVLSFFLVAAVVIFALTHISVSGVSLFTRLR